MPAGSEARLAARRAELEAALGPLGLRLTGWGYETEGFSAEDPSRSGYYGAPRVRLEAEAAATLLPLLKELAARRAEAARLRKALERIAGLGHDEGCGLESVPLLECGCYEKGPFELARMALDGVDWEPRPRRERATAELTDGDDVPDEPFWRCRKLLRDALSRLDEAAFAGRSLAHHDVVGMAVEAATETELAELRRLAAEDESCGWVLREALGGLAEGKGRM